MAAKMHSGCATFRLERLRRRIKQPHSCQGPVSYTHLTLPTSDLSVDLGGRRIIKKKKKQEHDSRGDVNKKDKTDMQI